MLSEGAAVMSGTLVPAIDQLYKDKKGAKKVPHFLSSNLDLE